LILQLIFENGRTLNLFEDMVRGVNFGARRAALLDLARAIENTPVDPDPEEPG
jgi:hypothetical protein